METTTPKQKILFFGSGDFPVRTFRMLIANGYEIAGLVTSKDRVFFESERLSDIANANNIPVYVPRTTDEPELLQWLDEHPADIFCVISYKYLKSDVLSKAKTAFNVHASLLPFLRGANPITWAIMNNFTETGLTAFELAEKIDCGDIIDNVKVAMDDNENYGTLYEKLASLCPEFTMKVIDGLSAGSYETRIKQQEVPTKDVDKLLFTAPKVDSNFTTIPQNPMKARMLQRVIQSITPKWALHIPVNVYANNEDGVRTLIKTLDLNVYDAEVITVQRDILNEPSRVIHTDFKTKMYFFENRFEEEAVSLKKVQLPGKKILDIEEFLRGLQYLQQPSVEFLIEF